MSIYKNGNIVTLGLFLYNTRVVFLNALYYKHKFLQHELINLLIINANYVSVIYLIFSDIGS
jgi:hypothetical protein